MYIEKNPKPNALKPMIEKDITLSWNDAEVVVSVLCITFNHENYIEDAICGFLAQRTNFAFEIIIRDDASTDKTAEIIEYYSKEYPRIIKTICEDINRYPLVDPFTITRNTAKGRFLAYCEGDDYWIDSSKLQKQVDFLLSNPNVSLLETNTLAIENNNIIDWPGSGGTRTYMHPASIRIPSQHNSYISFQDTYIRAILAVHGESAKLKDVTAVWRKHEGGIFGSNESQKNQTELNFKRAMGSFWISIYQLENKLDEKSFNSLRGVFNQLLDAYPDTTYSTRLKIASYLIIHPLIPLLSSIKKKVKRIL